MATIPSSDKVRDLQAQSAGEENEKARTQRELGKDFVNHGQGVIPEHIWTNLPGKNINNAEDIE